jgi:hypothetical protein
MARKQVELPGMERESIKELDAAIETYNEHRNEWVAAREKVQASKAVLVQLAKTHNVTVYRDETADPPLVLTLTERDATVKVTEMAASSTRPGSNWERRWTNTAPPRGGESSRSGCWPTSETRTSFETAPRP